MRLIIVVPPAPHLGCGGGDEFALFSIFDVSIAKQQIRPPAMSIRWDNILP
jgi:hypothetical protein